MTITNIPEGLNTRPGNIIVKLRDGSWARLKFDHLGLVSISAELLVKLLTIHSGGTLAMVDFSEDPNVTLPDYRTGGVNDHD